MENKLCEDCGEAIPPKRLELVPGCALCVRCQTSEEETTGGGSKYKMEISQEMSGGWFCEGVKYKIVKTGK